MAVRIIPALAPSVSRRAAWDGLFVALSGVHALLLVVLPSIPLVALGLWWNANTIAHNFIHRPFFSARWQNRLFSVWLSAVLGVPQSLWRARHLRHHREAGGAGRVSGGLKPAGYEDVLTYELVVIAGTWTLAAAISPSTFFGVYLPGYALGLVLCVLQGHFEHAGGTRSHYGRIYNVLFFKDGLHVEHHRRPSLHWTELTRDLRMAARASAWPPVLRWLEAINLDRLETLVLRSPPLQRVVLACHERAIRQVLGDRAGVGTIMVVGGGLFPRSAIILRRLFPHATITIVDSDDGHLGAARPHLDASVRVMHAAFDPAVHGGADLLVVPLAYRGDRRRFYDRPAAPLTLVHDWIWSTWSEGVVVSRLLLKRVNLVRR